MKMTISKNIYIYIIMSQILLWLYFYKWYFIWLIALVIFIAPFSPIQIFLSPYNPSYKNEKIQ